MTPMVNHRPIASKLAPTVRASFVGWAAKPSISMFTTGLAWSGVDTSGFIVFSPTCGAHSMTNQDAHMDHPHQTSLQLGAEVFALDFISVGQLP
jgi:hypothetical protein